MVKINRFDVFLIDLDPTRGHEIQKARPCVVISPDSINHGKWTVMVAPLTRTRRDMPTHIYIEFKNKAGSVVLDQSRFIDRGRIIKHLGAIKKEEGDDILKIMRSMFR